MSSATRLTCPSATFYNNTVTNNIGDGFRIKGGVVSAIDKLLMGVSR